MFRKLSTFGRRRSSDGGGHLIADEANLVHRDKSPSPSRIDESILEGSIGTQTSKSTPPGSLTGSSLHLDGRDTSGSLGLNVVYCPENGHKADIVFVHGLGGTSRSTWSKSKDPGLFWPLTFLAMEPDLCLARILTFGYNAAFRKSGSISTSILDFAKDLLFDLKFGKDQSKEDLDIGNVPLIFVVHSMGGLIVKEAYMQGQNDPEYQSIVRSIAAITFLATPHRGTNLAQTLNKILQSTMVSNSKQYVAELARNSFTLQKLNEQFRHIAPRLDIVSFYETQPTSIGLKNNRIMVLEKDSSVLGYPGETSRALDADHQGICKYDSPTDPNYITVRNVLKSIMGKIVSANNSNRRKPVARRASQDLKTLLGIVDLPVIDYSFFRDQWAHGTSLWILEDRLYKKWRDLQAQVPRILWVNGQPATGKSVLSSFIINELVEEGIPCQYFFIRYGDQKKRTLSLLLRSLAYQIGLCVPAFLERINVLADEAVELDSADPRIIWEQLFKVILSTTHFEEPLFWVIDGLDESEDPRALIKLLADLPPHVQLHVLVTSRKTAETEATFQRLSATQELFIVNIDQHGGDLRHYVSQELDVSGSEEFKQSIVQKIILKAQNNFLWARLAVQKINSARRQADIEVALEELPDGMEALYDRMASNVLNISNPADKSLTTNILQCVSCALRVMTLEELAQALGSEAGEILDLQSSIVDLCGGFVVIDNGGLVSMVHQTAREYLLGKKNSTFVIDRLAAHATLFASCMRSMTTTGVRAKLNRGQHPVFFEYASLMWASHLSLMTPAVNELTQMLIRFLGGQWVLTWIQFLATAKELRGLVQASKSLNKYFTKLKALGVENEEQAAQILKLELFDSWSIDLVKIVGKFGESLRQSPEAIYKLIPPFCPKGSSIYQQFGKTELRTLAVGGLSNQTWDDSLARIKFGDDVFASSISAVGPYIIVLASSGLIFVYDSTTFEQLPFSPISHGERVYRLDASSTGSYIATYGYKTTKIWKLSNGTCSTQLKNPDSRPRPLHMVFIDNCTTLLVALDDRTLRTVNLLDSIPEWHLLADLEEPELEGHNLNAANFVTINRGGSLAAIAYRGHPLSAWEVDGPVHIGHCWRKRDPQARGEVIDASWLPNSPEVLGLYIEGVVFKWSPYDSHVDELAVGAARVSVSGDGSIFATGDGQGNIKVYLTVSFGHLYEVAAPDTVFSLVISPDARRIYDVRGYYGNVWEPSVLIKHAETSPNSVDHESEYSLPVTVNINNTGRVDSILAVAVHPKGEWYAYSTEKGFVNLCHTTRGRVLPIHTSQGFLSVEQLKWCSDGKYIALAETSKRLFIKSMVCDTKATQLVPIVETLAQIPLKNVVKGAILDIEFQPTANIILIKGSRSLHTISLDDFSIARTVEVDGAVKKWTYCPFNPSLLLGFSSCQLEILDQDLLHLGKIPLHASIPNNLSETESQCSDMKLDCVTFTDDGKHALMQLITKNSTKTLKLADLSPLKEDTKRLKPLPTTIKITTIQEDITGKVSRPLSFLSRQRLIFISKTFSVCSAQLPTGPVKEHFFLPGDWISREGLDLCEIWRKELSFVCPRNGEVALVRCSAFS